MAVDLKKIAPPAAIPSRPVGWQWLLLLMIIVAGSIAYTAFNHIDNPDISSKRFWKEALILPLILWSSILGLNISLYQGRKAVAEKINHDRDRLLAREIARGQRFLYVCGVTFYTALRELNDDEGELQSQALEHKTQAIKTQASWLSDEGTRHSKLPRKLDESPREVLRRVLLKTLTDLKVQLSSLTEEINLSVLVENNTGLKKEEVNTVWQSCWNDSQIRHSPRYLEGSGLNVVDQWLDEQVGRHALLMIVAFQVVPEATEGTAEAIVGLLLEHPGIDTGLRHLGRLHRPEQSHSTDTEDIHQALANAFLWGNQPSKNIKGGWLTGVGAQWSLTIASGLKAAGSALNTGQDFHNMDTTIGFAGPAAPWLAIACAVNKSKAGFPQIIISGEEYKNMPLWISILNPDN